MPDMRNDKLTMADVPCLVAIGGPTCLTLQLLGNDKLTMADVPCLVALGGPTRPLLELVPLHRNLGWVGLAGWADVPRLAMGLPFAGHLNWGPRWVSRRASPGYESLWTDPLTRRCLSLS